MEEYHHVSRRWERWWDTIRAIVTLAPPVLGFVAVELFCFRLGNIIVRYRFFRDLTREMLQPKYFDEERTVNDEDQ